MTVFHKFYSRSLQFAADVLAALEGAEHHTLPQAKLEALSQRYGMPPVQCAEVLKLLTELELITRSRKDRSCSLETDWANTVPALPPSRCEEDYLQKILRLPQAELFLPEALREKLLRPESGPAEGEIIESFTPAGEQSRPSLSQPEFRCILEAITRSCAISYDYITHASKTAVRTTAVPWRLEFSAFDNRWWLILYTPEDGGRCVKAWLGNLSRIRLEPHVRVEEGVILAAREALRMPEPIVLRVRDTRNALERCFLAMEQQQFADSVLNDDGSATVSFRWYRFEQSDILRKLLYLGPAVELLAPAELRAALLERVEQALANFGG